MKLPKPRIWYLWILAIWALTILPGYIFGLLMYGIDSIFSYRYTDQLYLSIALDLLFISPVLLAPFGLKK